MVDIFDPDYLGLSYSDDEFPDPLKRRWLKKKMQGSLADHLEPHPASVQDINICAADEPGNVPCPGLNAGKCSPPCLNAGREYPPCHKAGQRQHAPHCKAGCKTQASGFIANFPHWTAALPIGQDSCHSCYSSPSMV